MTHVSLFSGIGGLDLAAEWAGFHTVCLVERDEFCKKVLAKNFPGVPIEGDVTEFDGTKFRGVTLVSAGFPCQPHSLAGKRLASGDERDLWGEVVRVLGEAQPEWFVGENVPGLLSSESGRFFGRVVDDLAALGYRMGWCMYGASDIGAVHRRKRIFIIAVRDVADASCERRQQESRGALGNEASDGAQYHNESTGLVEGAASDSNRPMCKGWPAAGVETRRCITEQCLLPTHTNRLRWNDGVNNRKERHLYHSEIRTEEEGQSKRSGREPGAGTNDSSRRSSIGTGDWRTWDVKPTICKPDDGISRGLVRSKLKALGNAVCPQQAWPIFLSIADSIRSRSTVSEEQMAA